MIYQVTASLYFEEQDEANDFYHDCDLAFAKSTIVNSDAINQEASHIQLIENHHDTDPANPCILIAERNNAPV